MGLISIFRKKAMDVRESTWQKTVTDDRREEGNSYPITAAQPEEDDGITILGEPVSPPKVLIRVLTNFFEAHQCVEKAYLVTTYSPSAGGPPHLVLGISFTTYSKRQKEIFFDHLLVKTKRIISYGMQLEMIEIGNDLISGYMLRSTEPVYSIS